MADGQMGDVLRHVRKLLDAQSLEEQTDGQLLERFLSRHEEAAFAALVRRHRPMVLAIGQRALAEGVLESQGQTALASSSATVYDLAS